MIMQTSDPQTRQRLEVRQPTIRELIAMSDAICLICEKRTPHARGLCGVCYVNMRRAGRLDEFPKGLARRRDYLDSVERECAFVGCHETVYVAERCETHRHRSANSPIRHEEFPVWIRIIQARVIDETTGCWVSIFRQDKGGYTRMSVRKKRTYLHRLAYEQFIGPIPEGLQLDHLCNNPPCCNPAHLEPVTAAENKRRAVARALAGAS